MQDLVVFVTGTGRGVGAALAEGFLERGCRVFAAHIDSEPGEAAALAARFGEKAVPVPIDIGNDDSVRRAAETVRARAGHLDIIANVAAVLGDPRAELPGPLDFTDMLRVFNVNALGALRVTNALFGLLAAGSTRLVVNVSSEAGSIGVCEREGEFAYCMSKSALNMASALVHNRMRGMGGRVLVVHPGWVRTWMAGRLDEAADLSPRESADGIITQVGRALAGDPVFGGGRPAYIDWRGDALPW